MVTYMEILLLQLILDLHPICLIHGMNYSFRIVMLERNDNLLRRASTSNCEGCNYNYKENNELRSRDVEIYNTGLNREQTSNRKDYKDYKASMRRV